MVGCSPPQVSRHNKIEIQLTPTYVNKKFPDPDRESANVE